MSSRSLPPYDEYESGAPPSYPGEGPSTSSHGLIFPDTTELYRATFPHYLLAPQIDTKPVAGNSLAHVNVVISSKSNGIGMRPESTVTLHSSTDKTSYPIGGVKITASSDSSDLTICKNPELGTRGGREVNHITLTDPGVGNAPGYSFAFSRDGGTVEEHFQWVGSRSNEQAKALARSNIGKEDYSQTNHGLVLISKTTNTMHAVYVPGKVNMNLNPRKVIAKLRFLPGKNASPTQNDTEKTWRLLVVLSMLSIIEKERQSGSRGGVKNSDAKIGAGFGVLGGIF